MMSLFVVLFFACFLPSLSSQINGIVGSAVAPVVDDVIYAYTFSQPTTLLTWISGSGAQVIQGMASESYQYGVSYEPADVSTLPADTKFFPFGAVAFVTPINFPGYSADTIITFNRETLARIFLGEIIMWNDFAIQETNPYVNMPNQTIQVVFRSATSGSTGALTLAFTTFYSNWSYGFRDIFPSNITAGNSRFHGVGSNIQMFAKIVDTPWSIGYTTLNTVVRQDAAILVPQMINRAGYTVVASNVSLHAAMDTVILDSRGIGEFIDPLAPDAWPIGHFMYGIVSTDFKNQSECQLARELGKFFNWIINFDVPHQRLLQDGAVPLSSDLTKQANILWSQVICEGQQLLYIESLPMEQSSFLIFLIVLDVLMLIVILVLTGVNLYYFSTPIINVGYTIIFSVGSLILFASPPLFMVEPTRGVCYGRVWLTSLGFSLVLGTMFSRTWQLRAIYVLSRKKFDKLHDVSVTSSLVKLVISMSIILGIILIFLGAWTGVDPFLPVLVTTDPLNLVGEMECVSAYFTGWITGLGVLILILIAFGIYVIYQTWSFQRQALLVETKWVLAALYNVLINLVAVVPIFTLTRLTQLSLSLVLCSTIIFSGTGIIFAVMLPRVINKLDLSETSKGSKDSGEKTDPGNHRGENQETQILTAPNTPAAPNRTNNDSAAGSGGVSEDEEELPRVRKKSIQKQSQSRTPEAEFVQRLEDPERGIKRFRPAVVSSNTSGRNSPTSHASIVELETLKTAHDSPPMQPLYEGEPLDKSTVALSPGLSSSQHPFLSSELSWSQNPLENRVET